MQLSDEEIDAQIETVQQHITLTLQAIDQNFAKCNHTVSSILPKVDKFIEISDELWQSSKIWLYFFQWLENDNNNNNTNNNDTTAEEDEGTNRPPLTPLTSASHPALRTSPWERLQRELNMTSGTSDLTSLTTGLRWGAREARPQPNTLTRTFQQHIYNNTTSDISSTQSSIKAPSLRILGIGAKDEEEDDDDLESEDRSQQQQDQQSQHTATTHHSLGTSKGKAKSDAFYEQKTNPMSDQDSIHPRQSQQQTNNTSPSSHTNDTLDRHTHQFNKNTMNHPPTLQHPSSNKDLRLLDKRASNHLFHNVTAPVQMLTSSPTTAPSLSSSLPGLGNTETSKRRKISGTQDLPSRQDTTATKSIFSATFSSASNSTNEQRQQFTGTARSKQALVLQDTDEMERSMERRLELRRQSMYLQAPTPPVLPSPTPPPALPTPTQDDQRHLQHQHSLPHWTTDSDEDQSFGDTRQLHRSKLSSTPSATSRLIGSASLEGKKPSSPSSSMSQVLKETAPELSPSSPSLRRNRMKDEEERSQQQQEYDDEQLFQQHEEEQQMQAEEREVEEDINLAYEFSPVAARTDNGEDDDVNGDNNRSGQMTPLSQHDASSMTSGESIASSLMTMMTGITGPIPARFSLHYFPESFQSPPNSTQLTRVYTIFSERPGLMLNLEQVTQLVQDPNHTMYQSDTVKILLTLLTDKKFLRRVGKGWTLRR